MVLYSIYNATVVDCKVLVVKGLYAAKHWYTARLSGIIRVAQKYNISADYFTWAGVSAGILGGTAIWQGYWVLAGVAIAARLAGANLDGAVARASNTSRPFGYVLNEIGDRLGDVFLMAGFVAVGWEGGDWLVLLACISMLFASFPTFISLAGAGAGVARINGGPYGKTERCLTLFIASMAIGFGAKSDMVIAIAGAVIIIGSAVTAVTRTTSIYRALRNKADNGENRVN